MSLREFSRMSQKVEHEIRVNDSNRKREPVVENGWLHFGGVLQNNIEVIINFTFNAIDG